MSAFEHLHPSVQQWVWEQGWRALRPVQEKAIPAVLARQRDVLIMAPTAGGKTEAAFLPAVSHVLSSPAEGLRILCVSPLRALISDQARRLETLGDTCGIKVQPWHGDVSRGKTTFWKKPAEILLITPESLEAMLMHRAGALRGILQGLQYICIDELHAFFDSHRGIQMQSLLHRVDLLRGGEVPRIGLSATLGDIAPAAEVLRRGRTEPPCVIRGDGAGTELKLVVKAFFPPPRKGEAVEDDDTGNEDGIGSGELPLPPETFEEAEKAAERAAVAATAEQRSTLEQIAGHMFERTRGKTALIFANSRERVELLTDAMVEIAEGQNWPVETFAHHGSLARDHRSEVEERLRKGEMPTQVVCTSTLELGIDIGDVQVVGQVGPPPSVAALKQRVGRSGRRSGTAQVLRQCVELRDVSAQDTVLDRLHLPLIQSIATIECLLRGEFELPNLHDLHLSTLVQQILSRIVQTRQGETAAALYRDLCGPGGAFSMVDKDLFVGVLRALGEAEVLEQIDEGRLLPGKVGERLTEHYSFYAAFHTPEEFLVLGPEGKRLGTLPLSNALVEGELLVYAGRRWRVERIDTSARVIIVSPGRKGLPPRYEGSGPSISRSVQRRMKEILESDLVPSYTDIAASHALTVARSAYSAAGIGRNPVIDGGTECTWFHFSGSRAGATLGALLTREGLGVEQVHVALRIECTTVDLIRAVAASLKHWPATRDELADWVPPVAEDKHDELLPPQLRSRGYVARHMELGEAREAALLLVP